MLYVMASARETRQFDTVCNENAKDLQRLKSGDVSDNVQKI